MKKTVFIILFLFSGVLLAEPKMEGSINELEAHFNDLSKTVTIDATASSEVPYDRAVIKLLIATEAKTLSNALQANARIRSKVREKIKAAGVDDKNIRESRFSSIPDYGLFGDEPDSYSVENTLSVVVSSEDQMMKVASISDEEKTVRYLLSKPEISNLSEIRNDLLKKALRMVKNRVKIYRSELNVRLAPESLVEVSFNAAEPDQPAGTRVSKMSGYSSAPALTSNFGEIKYTISIKVKYRLSSK